MTVSGPDVDAATRRPGVGVALWLRADDAQRVHDVLAEAAVVIVSPPTEGPRGRTVHDG